MNYRPSRSAEHFKACLGDTVSNISTCSEARDAYEAKLKSANGGALPKNYSPEPCSVLTPLLARAKEESVPAVPDLPPTSRTISRPFNAWPFVAVGFVALIVIGLLIIVGRFIRDMVRLGKPIIGRTAAPSLSDEKIREMFEKKLGDVSYQGLADKTIWEQTATGIATGNIYLEFTIARNIASMPHRERECLKYFLLMNNRGWIEPKTSDFIHFGLVYGDGRAVIGWHKYNIPHAVMGAANTNIKGAIAWYAREMGVSVDSAISQLMTTFGDLQRLHGDDPLIQEFSGVLSSGNRWFRKDDIPGSVFELNKNSSAQMLGALDDHPHAISYFGDGSLVTIAPPGAGKTQCHIIPNLLLGEYPMVVLDVKGELWRQTSKWRLDNVGPVYRFAPFEPQRSHSYNPLAAIRTSTQFLWEDCAVIAELMIVPRGKNDPFWEETAQRALTAFITYVCRRSTGPQDRSMRKILDLAAGVGLDEFFANATTDGFEPLMRGATSLLQMDEKTRSGVLSQMLTSLKSWEGERIGSVTSKSDWLPSSLRLEKATVYICVKPDEIELCLSVLRVVLGQHIRMLSSVQPADDAQQVLFLLDEFPQLRRMKPIEEGIAVGRGAKIKMWLVAQSLSQIRTHYEGSADGMIGQCGLRVYMNPSLQDGTAQKLSEDIGFFESVIDGTRHRIVEPQALAGPEFRNKQLVFTHSTRPLQIWKVMAHNEKPLVERMGEASWPIKRDPT